LSFAESGGEAPHGLLVGREHDQREDTADPYRGARDVHQVLEAIPDASTPVRLLTDLARGQLLAP
jgi:hypothetical protein